MSYDVVKLVPIFCKGFLGEAPFEEGTLLRKDFLPIAQMDYSIESLKLLNKYLEAVHLENGSDERQDYVNTVLAAGCYLGEVIRKHATRKYRWINYDEFIKTVDAKTLEFIKQAYDFTDSLGTCALLIDDSGGWTMPINKVGRFIEEGPENDVYFYATGQLK